MKLQHLIAAGTATAGIFLPLSAAAVEDLSYTFLEVDYVNLDIDAVGDNDSLDDFDNGGGIALRGSFEFANEVLGIGDRWFVFGDWQETESDVTFRDDQGIRRPAETDVIRFNVGAGMAKELNNMSELVFRLAYSDIDLEDFSFGASDTTSISDLGDDSSDGYYLDGRWRGQVTEMVELSAGLRYTDIEETDNVSFVGNALFELTENWGINVEADLGDELTTMAVGARFTF